MAAPSAQVTGTAGKMEQVEHHRPITIRRVPFTDHSQLPADYSATPGGTLFSTTPGGTRIIYDREFLLQFRNSPLAKNPPPNLPSIPGVTQPAEIASEYEAQDIEEMENTVEETTVKEPEADPQFAIDM